METALVAYIGLAALVTVSPGPDMALVMRSSFRGGTHAGIRATYGICCGLAIWAVASAVGVASVLAASPEAFTILQIAGAGYLIYLGVRAIVERASDPEPVSRPALAAGDFRAGFVSNLLNPKVGAFYLSVLPGFVEPGSGAFATSLALAAIHIAMGVLWLSLYSVVLARAAILARPRVRELLSRITGVVLVAFGARIIAGLSR